MRFSFEETKTVPKRTVAVSFDLSGFSAFCSRHDAYVMLPRLISNLFSELNHHLHGSIAEFLNPAKWDASKSVVEPGFLKYTGDGALMLWFVSEDQETRTRQSTLIVRSMRAFQQKFSGLISGWEAAWGIRGLPKTIRVGIAAGHAFELKGTSISLLDSEIVDYAGYCINLSVRLQNHCREIPFLVHETVAPRIDGLVVKTAKKMKGVLDEQVLIFEADLNISPKALKSKFS